MEVKNKSPPEDKDYLVSKLSRLQKTVKDPSLRKLVYQTIKDMDESYKLKDLDTMFKIGWRFGKYLNLFRTKYPERNEEALEAECEVRTYWIFHK